jgi:hypothetical protein
LDFRGAIRGLLIIEGIEPAFEGLDAAGLLPEHSGNEAQQAANDIEPAFEGLDAAGLLPEHSGNEAQQAANEESAVYPCGSAEKGAYECGYVVHEVPSSRHGPLDCRTTPIYSRKISCLAPGL